MPKFRKKPIVVEAVQFDPWHEHRLKLPAGVTGIPGAAADWSHLGCEFYVTTIQGVRTPIKRGEWVVTESDGVHHYPVAADEFECIYEPCPDDKPEPRP